MRSEEKMAVSATDVDGTRWVENETILKTEPSSKEKKDQDNVSSSYNIYP